MQKFGILLHFIVGDVLDTGCISARHDLFCLGFQGVVCLRRRGGDAVLLAHMASPLPSSALCADFAFQSPRYGDILSLEMGCTPAKA